MTVSGFFWLICISLVNLYFTRNMQNDLVVMGSNGCIDSESGRAASHCDDFAFAL